MDNINYVIKFHNLVDRKAFARVVQRTFCTLLMPSLISIISLTLKKLVDFPTVLSRERGKQTYTVLSRKWYYVLNRQENLYLNLLTMLWQVTVFLLTNVLKAAWLAVPANFRPITMLAPAITLQYAWLKNMHQLVYNLVSITISISLRKLLY